MEKPYLYGTIHGSEKSKQGIRNIFNKCKFDAVLSEGVNSQYQYQKILKKEPFLVCPSRIHFCHLKKVGSEFALAAELAKKLKIEFRYMDKSLNELVEYFHNPYNNIGFIIIFALILLLFYNFIMSLFHNYIIFILLALVLFIVVEFVYFGYFVYQVWNRREEFFYENIKKTIENKPYNRVLIICGESHTNFINTKIDCIDLNKYF